MRRKIRITVVVENTAAVYGAIPEHGISYWIDTGSGRVIFDTGQGGALINNARLLGVPLEKTQGIVFSHGHYDHTGGFEAVAGLSQDPKVYAHPAAFLPKFACSEQGVSRFIANPYLTEKYVRERAGDLVFTTTPTRIAGSLFATGEIPRVTAFEDTGGPFFLDEACTRPDPMLDDQALFFESSGGIVVLLGCAHAGVINTLLYIQKLVEGKPIHAVMGGMHLLSASRERMDRTIEHLTHMNPDLLGPAHCTGTQATSELRAVFSRNWFPCHAGASVEFDLT